MHLLSLFSLNLRLYEHKKTSLVCITLCPFWFCNHFEEEERAGCFAFIVVGMSCYGICSVALPHNAMGWSAVCDCGIS